MLMAPWCETPCDRTRIRAQRLDEDGDGGKPVGVYDVRDGRRSTRQFTLGFHDLAKTRRIASDDPSRVGGSSLGDTGRVELPSRPVRVVLGLERFPVDAATEGHLRKRKLLDHLFALIDHACLQQKSRGDVCPELVAVAKTVLRVENQELRLAPGHALLLADAHVIVFGQGRQLIREQRGKGLRPTFVDPYRLDVRIETQHLVVRADHFPSRDRRALRASPTRARHPRSARCARSRPDLHTGKRRCRCS